MDSIAPHTEAAPPRNRAPSADPAAALRDLTAPLG